MNLLSKGQEILEGWAKYKDLMPISIDDMAIVEARVQKCIACPNMVEGDLIKLLMKDNQLKEIQGYKCGLCGCPLSTKVRSTTSVCPDNPSRWEK